MAMSIQEFERLIKFMGMTGSSQDGEALNAIRMSNNLLMKHNHSWEEILRGKCKIENIQAAPGAQPAGSGVPHAPPPKHASKTSPADDEEVLPVVQFMEDQRYNRTEGFWGFVQDVCRQYLDEGWLSEKQWGSLKKSYDRQNKGGAGSNAAWQNV